MSTTDLVPSGDRHDVTVAARNAFEDEQKALIRHTVAPSLTPAEFDLFLELAARYQLNPLHGEIWAAKMPGRNGEPGKFTPIVGRDGFLAIANRHPDFEGFDADVVREADTFSKRPDGTYEHTFTQGPGKDGERDARGGILGSYCVVYRRGRRPVTFYAPWSEYNTGQRAWKNNPTAMILKCALANALRLAFNLSGLYIDAEMDRIVEDSAPSDAEADFGDDELGRELRGLVDAINVAAPGRYRPTKVRLLLANATDDERAAFRDALAREVKEIMEGGEVVTGEVVTDASEAPPGSSTGHGPVDLDQAVRDAREAAEAAESPEDAAEWNAVADRLEAEAQAA